VCVQQEHREAVISVVEKMNGMKLFSGNNQFDPEDFLIAGCKAEYEAKVKGSGAPLSKENYRIVRPIVEEILTKAGKPSRQKNNVSKSARRLSGMIGKKFHGLTLADAYRIRNQLRDGDTKNKG